MTTLTTIPTTMSSREIAELTGKEHRNVMRDFRDVCEALEIDALSFESVYTGGNGEQRVMFNLPKDLTTTLVSGYSIPMRHKIVTRWMELEAKQDHAVPVTFTQALRLALEKAEQLEVAQAQLGAALVQVEAQKPAVDFVEKFVEANEDRTLTMVAKTTGLTVKVLTLALIGDSVAYRRGPKGTILQCWMWSR